MTIGKISRFIMFATLLLISSCEKRDKNTLFKRNDIEKLVNNEINEYKNDKFIRYLLVYFFSDSENRQLIGLIPRMHVFNITSTYYSLNSSPKLLVIYQTKYLEDKFSNIYSKQEYKEFSDTLVEELINYDKYPIIYEILDKKLVKLKNNEELLEETFIGVIPFSEPKEPSTR